MKKKLKGHPTENMVCFGSELTYIRITKQVRKINYREKFFFKKQGTRSIQQEEEE